MAQFRKYIVHYDTFENSILFPTSINAFIIRHFASAINQWRNRNRYLAVTLDFSGVRLAYSNGMVPIIAIVNKLRFEGYDIKIRLPNDRNVASLFIKTNWAFYLSNTFQRATPGNDIHLLTRQFKNERDIAIVTNDFMDVVLRSMKIPKDVISALEWSMYEICDNVINHSNSRCRVRCFHLT